MGEGRDEMGRVFLDETVTLKSESETILWGRSDPGEENISRMLEPVSIGDELLLASVLTQG